MTAIIRRGPRADGRPIEEIGTVPFTADELAEANGGAIPMPASDAGRRDSAYQATPTTQPMTPNPTPGHTTTHAIPATKVMGNTDMPDTESTASGETPATPTINEPASDPRIIPVEYTPPAPAPTAAPRHPIPDSIHVGVLGGIGWRSYPINAAAWTLVVTCIGFLVPIIVLTVVFLMKLAVAVITGLTSYLFTLIGGLI